MPDHTLRFDEIKQLAEGVEIPENIARPAVSLSHGPASSPSEGCSFVQAKLKLPLACMAYALLLDGL